MTAELVKRLAAYVAKPDHIGDDEGSGQVLTPLLDTVPEHTLRGAGHPDSRCSGTDRLMDRPRGVPTRRPEQGA